MRMLALTFKDLLQITRDFKSAIFLVVLPVIFTLFFGFAFAMNEGDARLPVGMINRDSGSLGAEITRQLSGSDSVRLVTLEGKAAEQADDSVQKGKLAAVVVVPERYSEGALSGQPVRLTLIASPGSPAGQTALTAVQAAAKRAVGALQVAHVSADTVEGKLSPAAVDHGALVTQALDQANAAWNAPDLSVSVEKGIRADAQSAKTPSGFAQSSPGMIVQFTVFGLVVSAMVLVLERKSRTLQRMLTTPISRAEIIGGHLLAMFVVGLLQSAILVGLGQWAFGVNYMHEPLGTLLLIVTLALWGASLGLLISAIAQKEEQVIMFSLIAMFFFAALGGAWFPLEIAGKTFAAVGHLLPTAWAMDGLQNIAVRGLDLSSTLLPAGILLAYAAAFFVLAVWRFRYD